MLTSAGRRLLLVLVVIGVLTHAPGLGSPSQVVFDEVHWGKVVNAYCCTGERIFDVHPPHGKLLLTLGAVLAGYDGGNSFETIGTPYVASSAVAFRWLPALVGVTIPPLLFLLVLRLGGAEPTAFLAGALVALDNGLLLETHVMLFDGILVAAILAALVFLLNAEQATSPGAARLWRIASGASAGLAVGTKLTGLVAPALIVSWLGWRIVTRRRPFIAASQWGELIVPALLVYLGGWAIHFVLLTQPGGADAFHTTTGAFWTDLYVVHDTMFEANVNMRTLHPDGSGPLSWPWMKVAPFFWGAPNRSIHLVGNPIVWWGSAIMFAGIVLLSGLMRVTRLRLPPRPAEPTRLWWPMLGVAVAYLPFFAIERTLFLYHYLTPLVFAVTAVVLWLDRAGWIVPAGVERQRHSYYVVLGLTLLGFLAVSPLTYGFDAGAYDEWLVGVIRSWR